MKTYYERYWDDKEELGDFSYKWPVISNFIPKKKGIKILDFGCGKGVMSKEILKINPNCTFIGVDVSKKAIEFIKNEIPKSTFYQITDGGKLPFPNETFDFIVASDVLEHVYDTENAFSELGRVLKKGGRILVSVPYNGLLKRTIIALFFFDMMHHPTTPHIRLYTKKSLTNMLKHVKIHAEKIGYFGRFYPLSNGMYVVGKKK